MWDYCHPKEAEEGQKLTFFFVPSGHSVSLARDAYTAECTVQVWMTTQSVLGGGSFCTARPRQSMPPQTTFALVFPCVCFKCHLLGIKISAEEEMGDVWAYTGLKDYTSGCCRLGVGGQLRALRNQGPTTCCTSRDDTAGDAYAPLADNRMHDTTPAGQHRPQRKNNCSGASQSVPRRSNRLRAADGESPTANDCPPAVDGQMPAVRGRLPAGASSTAARPSVQQNTVPSGRPYGSGSGKGVGQGWI